MWLWRRQLAWKREAFIRHAALPRGLYDKLRQSRPELSLKDCQLVGNGLRTRHYDAFCRQAFGRFLHHTPAVVLARRDAQANAGLRRCWWYACQDEHLNPRQPTRLPLLFALDTKLGIAGGFRYALDCHGLRREHADGTTSVVYCGGDFASADIDGSTEGFGDGDGWGEGASDGGGDSGSGCGGGGCGAD